MRIHNRIHNRSHKIDTRQVILWIELGGKLKWFPLVFWIPWRNTHRSHAGLQCDENFLSIAFWTFLIYNVFFSFNFPECVSPPLTDGTGRGCLCPKFEIITYQSGRHDNNWCKKECAKLPNGSLAIPFNQVRYNRLVAMVADQGRTPLWTGIRVRFEGGLYDPRNDRKIDMYGVAPYSHHASSSYDTVLVNASTNRSHNCIYLHNRHYVESVCNYTHPNREPIMCACTRGERDSEFCLCVMKNWHR